MGSKEAAIYTHGHHPSVLRSHKWRTVLNSVAYLIPYLKSDLKILDIGCGPGTITVDLATYVPQGHITGLERSGDVLAEGRALAKEKGVTNVTFVEGDANSLDYPDESFDLVFCHQVLQHVNDPVGILREMKRVAKTGGVIAARESDYSSFTWYPEQEGMLEWQDMYLRVARANGGEPNAGRMLLSWARKAGFPRSSIKANSSTWCYTTPEEIEWWCSLWAERAVHSAFATTAVANKQATPDELKKISETWKKWGELEDPWFSILHGEVICTKE